MIEFHWLVFTVAQPLQRLAPNDGRMPGRSVDLDTKRRLLDTYGTERIPHAAGVVAHAVDTGRLIDELSGRAKSATGLDAAYGGGRPFPTIDHGMRLGDHPAVGRQLPQPVVDGRPLDELIGAGFGVVTDSSDLAALAEATWGDLATVITVPTGTVPFAVPEGGAAIVRPDRYVAAVAVGADGLIAASAALIDQLDAPIGRWKQGTS